MPALKIDSILASPPPLTLPAATTSLTALFTANSLTFPTDTISLHLQAQGGPMLIDPKGVNATANGSIVGQNQTIPISKAANDGSVDLGSIHVARGAVGATVKVICQ